MSRRDERPTSDRDRMAYAMRMGGATFAAIGVAIRRTASWARDVVLRVDRRIEYAAQVRERELWRLGPREWAAINHAPMNTWDAPRFGRAEAAPPKPQEEP